MVTDFSVDAFHVAAVSFVLNLQCRINERNWSYQSHFTTSTIPHIRTRTWHCIRVELIPFSLFPAFKLNCKKMNKNENERSKAKKRKYEKYSTVKIESVKRVCFVASYFILLLLLLEWYYDCCYFPIFFNIFNASETNRDLVERW